MTNAFLHQPVRDIPRVRLDKHLSSAEALPVGEHKPTRTRPVIAGGTFTDAEIAADFHAHRNPDTVYEEQLHSAIVYAARNEPDRIALGWMRTLLSDARATCAERLDLFDVDCHRCKRSVFVRETSDPCPSCHLTHAVTYQQMLDAAIDLLRASGLVRS